MPDDKDNNGNEDKKDEDICPFCNLPTSQCDCNLQGTH